MRALLPELPQADAERLIRYYWRDDIDGTAATERIDDKIKHRITMAIYRTQYNGACCEQLEESYLKGAVYALAETVNRCGPLLDEDYLQRAADRLELPEEAAGCCDEGVFLRIGYSKIAAGASISTANFTV